MQHSLDLRTSTGARLSFQLPMLDTEGVRGITGLDEDEILAEIETGKLLWAWDLARKDSDRKFLRVWNRSVICWINPHLDQAHSFESVLDHILPHHREALRCKELSRAFNCSSQHALNLLEDKLMTRLPGGIGPKESPYVTRASVVSFLESRRLR